MKLVVRGSSVLAALLGKPQARAAKPPLLLRRGAAGSVQLGMPARGLKVRRRGVTLAIEGGVVVGIQVRSPRYKTEAGIGVGDSLFKLANEYRIRWAGDHQADVEDLGMRFHIEMDRITSIVIW